MTLTIDVMHRQGAFDLTVDLAIGGGLTALFGPSGSGKTTLVNLVAGLIRPDSGSIAFDGETWVDGPGRRFVPPHRRRIGYVFQEARLFPHMTVRGNLRYGARFAPRGEPGETLDRVVELLRIGHLLDRRPALLSGGEKQRVALGRALMAKPRLLLMDEPLSALDNDLKAAILPDIERMRDEAGIPILYVSHSIEEVTRLATRVVVMAAGKSVAIGRPDEVLNVVPTSAGAMKAGSFLHAVVTGHSSDEGLTFAESRAGPLFLRATDIPVGAHIRAFVPTSEVVLATSLPDGISTLNRLKGRVEEIGDAGSVIMVSIDCNGDRVLAEITRRSAANLGLVQDMPINLLFKTVSIAAEGIYRTA
jgi:molybdate transport system ATP-binding protein